MTNAHQKSIRAHAHSILADWQSRAEDYRQACDEAYAEGFRPQYCEHGTYMWVDYDVMCQGCEDGFHYDNQTFVDALSCALSEYRAFTNASFRFVAKVEDFKTSNPTWKNLEDPIGFMRQLYREDYRIIEDYLNTLAKLG